MIVRLKVEQPLRVRIGVCCFGCEQWDVVDYPIHGQFVRFILSKVNVDCADVTFPGMYVCQSCDKGNKS